MDRSSQVSDALPMDNPDVVYAPSTALSQILNNYVPDLLWVERMQVENAINGQRHRLVSEIHMPSYHPRTVKQYLQSPRCSLASQTQTNRFYRMIWATPVRHMLYKNMEDL